MQNVSLTARGAANFFAEIRRFPMLKAEEEHMLAARWRERGDRSAAHRLLTSHLRLVAKMASASVAAMQARIKSLSGVDRSEICTATRPYFLEVVKAGAVTALCKALPNVNAISAASTPTSPTLTRQSPRVAYDNMIRLGM